MGRDILQKIERARVIAFYTRSPLSSAVTLLLSLLLFDFEEKRVFYDEMRERGHLHQLQGLPAELIHFFCSSSFLFLLFRLTLYYLPLVPSPLVASPLTLMLFSLFSLFSNYSDALSKHDLCDSTPWCLGQSSYYILNTLLFLWIFPNCLYITIFHSIFMMKFLRNIMIKSSIKRVSLTEPWITWVYPLREKSATT